MIMKICENNKIYNNNNKIIYVIWLDNNNNMYNNIWIIIIIWMKWKVIIMIILIIIMTLWPCVTYCNWQHVAVAYCDIVTNRQYYKPSAFWPSCVDYIALLLWRNAVLLLTWRDPFRQLLPIAANANQHSRFNQPVHDLIRHNQPAAYANCAHANGGWYLVAINDVTAG